MVAELVTELGRAFDLATPIAGGTLGEAVERRLRGLGESETPEWGSPGTLTQLARRESGALDFYYRPHLFPGMDPALRLGHELQFDLLPRRLPPESPLRVAAVLESFCHLSGDLLGWRMEGDELFLWVADVSGHGVRAGLAAATLYFLIEDVERGLPPGAFAERLNDQMLAAKNPDDRRALFATAVWLRADRAGRVAYASSGHNPMLVRRRSGGVEELGATGRPLGMLPGERYGDRELRLAPGDVVCLFTDGLVEARSPDDEEMGLERLRDLPYAADSRPLDLTRTIYDTLRSHQGARLLDDDLTFLVADLAAPA